MKKLLEGITATIGVGGAMALYFGGFVGWAYWMWMAIQFGSFLMFVVGIFPPLAVLAGLVGLWSLVIGVPMWLLRLVS